MSLTTSEYEGVEHQPAPIPINGHAVSPPAQPSGPRILRREVWVPISEEDYPDFKAKVWVNYPRKLLNDVNQSEDAALRVAALCQMVTAHNGWLDIDGTPLPPTEDPAFWDKIPDQLAAALIALVNHEAGKLAFNLATQPRKR